MTSDIRRFITQYVFAALIGTLVIVFAAPFVNRAALPPAFDAIDSNLRLIPGVPEASAWVCKHLQWKVIRQTATEAIKPPAVAPAPAVPAPAPVVRPQPPRPPPVASRKQGYWAVVRGARVPCYNAKGKFICRLAPGTLADVREIRKTKSGDLAVCHIPNGKPADRDVLISLRDLDIQTGTLEDADKKEVELRVDRARLRTDLETLRRDAAKTPRADNPHTPAYSAADSAYKEYVKKARELQARHDAATGDARMQISDELRMLKADDLRLSAALARAKRECDEWSNAHPPTGSSAPPEILRIETRLAEVNTELERMKMAGIEKELEE